MATPVHESLPLGPQPMPTADEGHLWLCEMSTLGLPLGANDTGRADRIRQQRISQQFLLRLLLGAYLGVPGKSVAIERDSRGKPRLAGQLADSGITFNLSHSKTWLAIVLGRETDVGVDIETARSLPRAPALAGRYFPQSEAKWLCRQPEPARSRAFLEHWTAREALVKAAGTGLAGAMAAIELDPSPPSLVRVPHDWPDPPSWTLSRPAGLPSAIIAHAAACRPDWQVSVRLLRAGPG